jgi:glutamate synthase domain-containing protein 1/glutamate synthase domain-containing protein 3
MMNEGDGIGHWLLEEKFGQRASKDGCGVFGVLRKKGSPKISNVLAVEGISCAKYRGSHLGAGFACLDIGTSSNVGRPNRIMAFVKDGRVADEIEGTLSSLGIVRDKALRSSENLGRMMVWEALLEKREEVPDDLLEQTVDAINSSLISDSKIKGRIFSWGKCLKVYKEVGFPNDVAKMYDLDVPREEADLWISHTRQPTNSPGSLPIWSHPFASMDCAIVHNGDISSFGANVELLKSWGSTSFVGTDSEVVARLLDSLVRVRNMTISEAATVLTNPFEQTASKETIELIAKYRGAGLDGPFSIVAGYSEGDDCYLIALCDRSKFRPLVLGEDQNCFYVASEESQIRFLSKDATVWTPEPGAFFIASLKKGLIESGTRRVTGLQEFVLRGALNKPERGDNAHVRVPCEAILANDLDFKQINELISNASREGRPGIRFTNLLGQRYIGIGFSSPQRTGRGSRENFRIELNGFPGNCLANLNDGATFEVFGSVADDVADTMHSGSILVHGNARDVLGQAVQGGVILVRGSVGNRAAIQMREYNNSRPFLVVGETADDYLGEYMAGGIVCILNLSDSPYPVGRYVGTGMVGGRIYVRGILKDSQVGLPPQKQDVLRYLKIACEDGRITKELYKEISDLDFPSVQCLKDRLPKDVFERVKFLFFSNKYAKPLSIKRRKLIDSDFQLISEKLDCFFESFSISESEIQRVKNSEFTIIQAGESEEDPRPLPVQEIPVEE